MSSAVIDKLFSDLERTKAELEKIKNEKLAIFEKAKIDLAEALDNLNKFNQVFAKVEAPKQRKKPGPKPGAKRGRPKKVAAPVKAKVKGKPGPKPKAKAKPAKPVKKAKAKPVKKGRKPRNKNPRAAEGRAAVARGDRPPIKEAVRTVMSNKTMNAGEILDLVKAKKWTPNANDPKGYIAYILSANKDTFERVPAKGRGFYRVLGANNGKPKAEAPAETKPAKGKPGPKPKAAKAEADAKNTDAILAEAGVGTGDSLFSG